MTVVKEAGSRAAMLWMQSARMDDVSPIVSNYLPFYRQGGGAEAAHQFALSMKRDEKAKLSTQTWMSKPLTPTVCLKR